MMKITFRAMVLLVAMIGSTVFAQEIELDLAVRYTKTIESNRLDASDSVNSKTRLDKRFFGDFNARLQYLHEPSFKPPIGLRIYRMPSDTSFVLEVKRVTNYKEVNTQLNKEFPLRGISINDISSISKEESDRITAHNRDMIARTFAERQKRYKIAAIIVPISDSLADILYDKTVGALRLALPVGKSLYAVFDGDLTTFRCVVDDNELWTLRYRVPEGELEALSHLFRQMIVDVEAGKFDEAKYIEALN